MTISKIARFLFVIAATLAGTLLWGQTPLPAVVQKSPAGAESFICPPGAQNDAGTYTFGTFNGQSSDIVLDTIYFCFGDELEVLHQGGSLAGDPNMATPGGYGYAFYSCPPTVAGPDINAINGDNCAVLGGTPPEIRIVTEGIDGDVLFGNDGTLITNFNGGDPGIFYFAPITYDSLVVTGTPPNQRFQAGFESGGPCVDVNIDDAFAVGYLNPVVSSGLQLGNGVAGCGGSFIVEGGLPELNGSTYDVEIRLQSDPNITASINGGPYSHGDLVDFTTSVPGNYIATVSDGVSCSNSFSFNVSNCQSILISVPDTFGLPGEIVCVPIIANGLIDVIAFQFGLQYDSSILEVVNIQSVIPFLTIQNNTPNIVGSGSTTSGTFNYPNGVVLGEVCFRIIGPLNSSSPINVLPGFTNEFVYSNGTIATVVFDEGGIDVSADLTIATSQDSVSCSDSSDGAFTITPSGGVPVYDIDWISQTDASLNGSGQITLSGNSFTQSSLPAGLYDYSITDASGRIETGTIEILAPPMVVTNITFVGPRCTGDSTGVISANIIIGGVPVNPSQTTGYSYQWNVSTQDVSTLTNQPTGNYAVTVTTPNGCISTATSFMPEPAPIDPGLTLTNASCSGIADGRIQLSVTGGTALMGGGYQIEFPTIGAGVSITSNMANLSNLDAGTYIATIEDANGCLDSLEIDLLADKILDINATVDSASCRGLRDGSIFAVANTTGGTSANYTFAWTGVPPPPAATNTATTSELNNLAAGVYTLRLMDDEGCTIERNFGVGQPLSLVVDTVIVTDVTCGVGNDGSATPVVLGGTPGFSFNWNSTPVQTDSIATNLAPGSYQLVVTDANGCTVGRNVDISAPAGPMIVSLPNDTINCANGTDGMLTVTASPNPAPIASYLWTPTGATTPSINGLSPGSYSVAITDVAGCLTIATAEVIANSSISVDSIRATSPDCAGFSNGSAALFVSGGAAPYNFTWDFGDSTITVPFTVFPGLSAGTYPVTITDANNCLPGLDTVITIVDPLGLGATFSAIDSVSCTTAAGASCDGTATATGVYSDGTAGTFEFRWESGELTNNAAFSTAVSLCSGWQQITITETGGFQCVGIDSVFIPKPDSLFVSATEIIDVSCFGDQNGSITLAATGGTPGYNYFWQHGPVGPTVRDLSPGLYQADVFDAKNCRVNFAGIAIEEPDELIATINPVETTDPPCFDEPSGRITIDVMGGNDGPKSFTWSSNVTDFNDGQAFNLLEGAYSVTVVDRNGCSDSTSQVLVNPPPINFTLEPIEDIRCFGFQTFVTLDSVWGGSGSLYTFAVDRAPFQSIMTEFPIFFGDRLIQVQDGNGCIADTTIFVQQPPELIVSLPTEIEVELGDSITLRPQIIPAVNIDSFTWTPETQLSNTNTLRPTVTPVQEQLYTLEVWDIDGCSGSGSVLVTVDANRNVFIPNIFSPNADGKNDIFRVFTGNGVTQVRSFNIYDRWGNQLFSAANLTTSPNGTLGWDGTFQGEEMKPGLFVYTIEVEFQDGVVLLYRGDITLVR